MISSQTGAGAWHEGVEAGYAQSAELPICTAGGCPVGVRRKDVPHEFDGVEHDMSRRVTGGVLESMHDLSVVTGREEFVRGAWAGDGAAQALKGVSLVGMAARAAMERESRELSDPGIERKRVGRAGS